MARSVTAERAFPFLRVNTRRPKPRSQGVTEIRGPYYTPIGKRNLECPRSGIWGTKSLWLTYKG
jgi:hypothetical protein